MCWLHLWDTKTFHIWWPSISWWEFVIVISYPMAGCVVKRMQTMSLHSIRINACEWIHRTYLHLCCKISKIQPHESPHVYCCLWHVICMSSESRVYKPIVICNSQTRLQAPSYPPLLDLKAECPSPSVGSKYADGQQCLEPTLPLCNGSKRWAFAPSAYCSISSLVICMLHFPWYLWARTKVGECFNVA